VSDTFNRAASPYSFIPLELKSRMNGKDVLKAWLSTLPVSQNAQKEVERIYTQKRFSRDVKEGAQ